MGESFQKWDEFDLKTQKEEYENQRFAWQVRTLKKKWAENYIRLARALADEFGEEEVLDILEEIWFDRSGFAFERCRALRGEVRTEFGEAVSSALP